MRKRINIISLLLVSLAMIMASCKDSDDPVSEETVIYKIGIANAGPWGDLHVEGIIDEKGKSITFAELPAGTDPTCIRFAKKLSDGAQLDQKEYDFSSATYPVSKTITVINGSSTQDYVVILSFEPAPERRIYSININAGFAGDVQITGIIDEENKTISFPVLPAGTNPATISFDAELSEGAMLDALTYNFTSETWPVTRDVTVISGVFTTVYWVTIEGIEEDVIPATEGGADFSKIKVYDYSAATPTLSDFGTGSIDSPTYSAANTDGRQYSLSLNNVLVVNRPDKGPVLLSIANLKNGTLTPTALTDYNTNPSDPLSASYAANGGVLINGHIYTCNLLAWGTAGLIFRVWNETTPTVTPTTITVNTTDIQGFSGRYDGFVSADIDASGNGYLFTHSNNNGTTGVARVAVSGFTTKTSAALISSVTPHPGTWSTLNRVGGASNEYIYTGHEGAINLTNANAEILYTVPVSVIATDQGVDAKVFNFNDARYLITMSATSAGGDTFFRVYDITQGATVTGSTQDALQALTAENINEKKVFEYNLKGAAGQDKSISTAWIADSDRLYLLSGAVGAGFALFEIPKKQP
ncbi:DUF4623 domain-containing protein [Dysgonomonas reticulitermitis]